MIRWLSSVVLTRLVAVMILFLALIRLGWRPIFRILFDHGSVVIGRGVMEIHLHRWRSLQRVDRNPARCRLRNPPATFWIGVLATAAAVIDLISGIINVVILHGEDGVGFYIHISLRRTVHITDASIIQRHQKPCAQ